MRLDGVTKRFDDVVAVDGVSLEIPRGSFFALLGPSGCGKTTTLRMIGGFEEPTAGTIYLGDSDVTGLPPYKRDVNTVFQSYALFPHLTIFENVAFGLRRRGVKAGDLEQRVAEALELVALTGFERRKPRQLSGGQQQRVALARALVNRPRVLLLDEPLGALDLKLRKQMQLELKRIQHEVGITFVHVTHDQEEAMTMADAIAVMNAGTSSSSARRPSCTRRPTTAFVAGFLGVSNLLSGTTEGDGEVRLEDGTVVRVAGRARGGRGRSPSASARRRCGSEARRGTALRRGAESAYIGVSTQYIVSTPAGAITLYVQNAEPGAPVRPGQQVTVSWSPDATFVVESRGGEGMKTSSDNQPITRACCSGAPPPAASRSRCPLLAACGGGGGIEGQAGETAGTTTVEQTLADQLVISNWPLYIDIDEKTKKRPTIEQFTRETASRSATSRTSTTTRSGSGSSRPSSRRPVDRPRPGHAHRLDGRADARLGYLEKKDNSAIPNAKNLEAALQHPGWDPNREYSLAWQSGLTGIAYNPKLTGGDVTSVDQLLTSEAEGQGHDARLDGRHGGALMLENGDDPPKLDPDGFNEIREAQGAVDSGRSASSRATTTRAYSRRQRLGVVRLVGRHRHPPARQPGARVRDPRRRRDLVGGQHADPEGRRRLHGVDVHELRLRPEDRRADRGVRELHHPGVGAKEEITAIDPALAENPLIFPPPEVLANMRSSTPRRSRTPSTRRSCRR